jgi:hypothetical protein
MVFLLTGRLPEASTPTLESPLRISLNGSTPPEFISVGGIFHGRSMLDIRFIADTTRLTGQNLYVFEDRIICLQPWLQPEDMRRCFCAEHGIPVQAIKRDERDLCSIRAICRYREFNC